MSDQLQTAYEAAVTAVDNLRVAAGIDLVNEMGTSGQFDILYGGLSAMACQIDGAAGTYAQLVLEAAGLDPLSSIPPNVPVFMGLSSKDVEKLEGGNRDKEFSRYNDTAPIEDLCPGSADILAAEGSLATVAPMTVPGPAEPMVTLERRRLVGTIIMAQALSNMLARKPKNSRRDVIDKIDMMIDTIYDSFGVSRQEVRTALYGDDGDVLDNEVLEAGARLAS